MGIKLVKKESMERCDSCGAVMTEYDYDRYGGLCKYCRSKESKANGGRVTSYFVVNKNAEEKAVEKIVSTLEDAILGNQTVETTANADGTVSLEIYGRMTPDEVARALQLPGQLSTSYTDLAINSEG